MTSLTAVREQSFTDLTSPVCTNVATIRNAINRLFDNNCDSHHVSDDAT